MDILVNIINFAKKHFLSTEENHTQLKNYLNHYYYHNGAIDFNDKYDKIISQNMKIINIQWDGNNLSYTIQVDGGIHNKQQIVYTETSNATKNNDKLIGTATVTKTDFTIGLKKYVDTTTKTYYTGCETLIKKED